MTVAPEATAGPFDLVELLGRGGMGEVWRAHHGPSRVQVAVKLLTGAAGARRDTFHSAFANEVRLSLALDHPHVVRVLDHGTIAQGNPRFPAGTPYLAMELGPSTTLSRHVGRLRWAKIRWVLDALLAALAHAHARGVVHRDVKPGNVLADPTVSQVQLTDFGLAHALEAQPLEGARVFVGTPMYMAPEQYQGSWRDIGPWTDLYSLGVLAYSLAAGAPPFPNATSIAAGRVAHLSAEPEDLPEGAPVPSAFAGWLAALLAKDPGRRFQRAADARHALSQLPDADPDLLPLGRKEGEDTITLTSDVFPTESGEVLEAPWDASPTSLLSAALARPLRPAPPLPDHWRDAVPAVQRPTLDDAGVRLIGIQSPPLVGRQQERDALWSELRAAVDEGRPRAVLLPGPTGVGKRRLARWLCERAHELGSARILEARHEREPGPGHGIGGMLDRLLTCTGLDRQGTLARLRQIHAGLDLDDPELALGLLEWMRADDGPQTLGDEPLGGPRFAAVVGFLQHLGRSGRPMVLLLDEVQWGTQPAAFARALLEDLDAAALVLMTVTPELVDDPEVADDLGALEDHDRVRALPVAPLTDDELDTLLGWYGLSDSLARHVRSRAAGNPMFAVQLLGSWVERGLLAPSTEGLVLRGPVEEALPSDLEGVWMRRLDEVVAHLEPSELVALERAAVLGPAVDHGDWDAVCRPGGAPVELLEELMDRQLARSVGPKLGGGWAFVHPMLREALLASARDAGRLAGHHEACVMWLAGRPGPGVSQRLARHLMGAGRAREALGPLIQAARERRLAGDTAGALALLLRRDQALEQLDVPSADPRWGPTWLERARVHVRRGEPEDARHCLDRAEEVARPGSAIMIAVSLLRAHDQRRRGRYEEALQTFELALTQAESLGNRRLQADAALGASSASRALGRFERAEALAAQAEARFEVLDHPLGRWRSRKTRGMLALQRGDRVTARRCLREAVAMARAMSFPWGRATVLLALGDLERYDGHLDRARTHYARAAEVFERIGARSSLAYAEHNLGLVALEERDAPAAQEAFVVAERTARDLEERPLLADVLVGRAATALALAHPSDADRHLREAMALYDDTGVVDVDSARLAEVAAAVADEAGQGARAQTLRDLAARHWRALGRDA